MKAVIDKAIPYMQGVAERLLGEVVYVAGAEIGPEDVRDADVLIVRTRTHCNEALLQGSRVRQVVTATIGFDHLDTDYLDRVGIAWTNCAGCNAASVAQYVESSLLVLERKGLLRVDDCTVGIVGVGHVGSQVAEKLRMLGCRLLLNDPLRVAQGESGFVPMQTLAEQADVITFHVPLTREGPYATWHMADCAFFSSLKQRPIIINAARGGVVDEQMLLAALDNGSVRAAVIDTWEGEPHISQELLQKSLIATPHVAGYSADGKCNASRMSLEAVCRFWHISPDFQMTPPPLPENLIASEDLVERKLQLYNPLRDTEALRRDAGQFEYLRSHYPLRREQFE